MHPDPDARSATPPAADPSPHGTEEDQQNNKDENGDGVPSLKTLPRRDIELQLQTVASYLRTKKLPPLRWTCCHCARRQPYRDGLATLDSLRCANPACGVSERGFRLCAVHEMCGGCVVVVVGGGGRVPVTKRGLRQKREEIREVLRKVKRAYDEVEALLGFDGEEADRVARAVEEKEAREGWERERRAEEAMERAEREREQNEAEAMAMAMAMVGAFESGCEEDRGDGEDEGHMPRQSRKKGGLKGFFGL